MINITTEQKIFSIRYIIETNYQQSITKIIEDVVISSNSIKLEPSVPYVIDKKNNNNYIIIPENLYESIIDLINNK